MEHFWKESPERISGSITQWVPIASIQSPTASDITPVLQLGLAANGFWVLQTGDDVVEYRPGVDCLYLLPLLEHPEASVKKALKEGLRERGLDDSFLLNFPFEAVVEKGLLCLNHWALFALTWCEGLVLSQKLLVALAEAEKRGVTQEVRHKSRRLIGRR